MERELFSTLRELREHSRQRESALDSGDLDNLIRILIALENRALLLPDFGVRQAARIARQTGVILFFYDVKRSLEAFQRASRHTPNDPHLLLRIGDLHVRTGNRAEATLAYRTALQLSADAGQGGSELRALCHQKLGRLLQTEGKLSAASDEYAHSLRELSRQGEFVKSAESHQIRAVALTALGEIRVRQGALSVAIQHFREGRELLRQILAVPEAAGSLASYGRVSRLLGETLATKGAVRDARQVFVNAIELIKGNLGSDEAPEVQHEFALLHRGLGQVLFSQGLLALASEQFDASATILRKLLARDASNLQWRFENALLSIQIASLTEARGSVTRAMEQLGSDLLNLQLLVGRDPHNMEWMANLRTAELMLGYMKWRAGSAAHMDQLIENLQATAIALGKSSEDSGQAKHLLAVANLNLGFLRALDGDHQLATTLYKRADMVLDNLIALDSTNAQAVGLKAHAGFLMGDSYLGIGKSVLARQTFNDARTLLVELMARTDDSGSGAWLLALIHERLGLIAGRHGNLSQAFAEHQRALEIREQIVSVDPSAAYPLLDVGHSHLSLGDLYKERGDLPKAQAAFETSLRIFSRLVRADDTNAIFARAITLAHERLGLLFGSLGDRSRALENFRLSLDIRRRLLEGGSSSQADYSFNLVQVAEGLAHDESFLEAESYARRALSMRENLLANAPENVTWQQITAESHNVLGSILLNLGNYPEAVASLRKAHEMYVKLAELDVADTTFAVAKAESVVKIAALEPQASVSDLRSLNDAVWLLDTLVFQDPSNAHWKYTHLLVKLQALMFGIVRGKMDMFSLRLLINDLRNLARHYPDNLVWKLATASKSGILSFILISSSRNADIAAEAKAISEEIVKVAHEILAIDPSNQEAKVLVGFAPFLLAATSFRAQDSTQAIVHLREGIRLMQINSRPKAKRLSDFETLACVLVIEFVPYLSLDAGVALKASAASRTLTTTISSDKSYAHTAMSLKSDGAIIEACSSIATALSH